LNRCGKGLFQSGRFVTVHEFTGSEKITLQQRDTLSNCHPEPSESAEADDGVSKDPEDVCTTRLRENSSTIPFRTCLHRAISAEFLEKANSQQPIANG
jgi:hypothetical protein